MVNKKHKGSKLLLKLRPIDIAKQLTLLEKELFCKITTSDLMMAAWKKKDKAQGAPNVVKIIEWFNKIAAWAQTVVVVTENLRDRIGVLSRLIQIAEHCIELHNYSTGMELVSGLRCSSVSRLTRTWKGLGRKEMAAWEVMSEIFDAQGNFSTYRRLIHLAHGDPSIPYLGVVLQDLLMVEELPTFLPNHMVNFKKMRRFASLLRAEIQDRQAAAAKYAFEATAAIHKYFETFATLSDADLYRLSRLCEPATLA